MWNFGSANKLPQLDCNTMCKALGIFLALVLASKTGLSVWDWEDKVGPELWSVMAEIFQTL